MIQTSELFPKYRFLFMVVVMLLMYSVLHCLYSIGIAFLICVSFRASQVGAIVIESVNQMRLLLTKQMILISDV